VENQYAVLHDEVMVKMLILAFRVVMPCGPVGREPLFWINILPPSSGHYNPEDHIGPFFIAINRAAALLSTYFKEITHQSSVTTFHFCRSL
jgi:hypothetical protein